MNGISVIIPLGDAYNGKAMPERWEALEFSIRTFYAKHENIELILVCQNVDTPKEIDKACQDMYKESGIESSVIRLSYPVFNKGWCCNVGAKAAKYDNICIAESDMWAIPYLNKLNDKISRVKWIIAWNELAYTSKSHRRIILNDKIIDRENSLKEGTIYVTPKQGASEGGLVVFNKEFFFSIGGCNEWFEELGGPDNEIARRAGQASGCYNICGPLVFHLWHPKCRDMDRPTRKRNRLLYQSTVRHTAEFNKFLAKQDFGNPKYPLIARRTFKQAWSEQ